MTRFKLKPITKLALAAAAACLICALPLLIPITFAASGAAALGMGQWMLGVAIFAGLVVVALRYVRSNAGKSECCGPDVSK